MKAIVKNKPGPGLVLEERPIPEIGENDLLIKIHKTAICGTDIHLYKWDDWAAKTLPVPAIIGHEFIGVVEKIGKNVTEFSPGDRVSGEGHITCGHCQECRNGRRVLCPKTSNIAINGHGCFAQYFRFPAENAFKMPEEIPDEIATLFDPLGNAVHSALSTEIVGKDVLITGAGPIGLMCIPLVKKAGARHVVISDVNPYRLALSEQFQPTRIVDVSKESLANVALELGIPLGFDVSLEMSGSARAFATLADVTACGGDIILLGIIPENATINWHQVIFKMLRIKGIYGREIFRTWHQTLRLLQSGLDVSPVITHQFPADEFIKGFEVMLSGNSGKVILDWTTL